MKKLLAVLIAAGVVAFAVALPGATLAVAFMLIGLSAIFAASTYSAWIDYQRAQYEEVKADAARARAESEKMLASLSDALDLKAHTYSVGLDRESSKRGN